MAVSQYTPNLNSLRPGFEIVGVKSDALASAGGDVTFTFDQAFAKAPDVISVYAIDPDGLATVCVKSVSATQIVLDYDTLGTGDDVTVVAIVQGCVS